MRHAEMTEWTPRGQWMTVLSGGTATAVVLLKKKAMDVGLLETAGRASIRCLDSRYAIVHVFNSRMTFFICCKVGGVCLPTIY